MDLAHAATRGHCRGVDGPTPFWQTPSFPPSPTPTPPRCHFTPLLTFSLHALCASQGNRHRLRLLSVAEAFRAACIAACWDSPKGCEATADARPHSLQATPDAAGEREEWRIKGNKVDC